MSDSSARKEPGRTLRRRKWFRAAAVAGSLIAGLLIAEFFIFLSGINNDYRSLSASIIIPRDGGPYELSPHGFVPFAKVRHVYPTNPRGYFDRDFGINHVFNSEGWRDDEHPTDKPEGVFRILGLGDSFMCGQGVKREDLFLTHLGNLLNDGRPEQDVETINTGQFGYNTPMERALLENRGLDYHPDLVLLAFVPNDVEPDIYTDQPKVEFLTEFTTSYVEPDWLSEHSELWMFARRKLLYRSAGQQYLRQSIDSYLNDPEKWSQCRDALAGIRNLCNRNNCRFAVVIFPFFINLNGDYPFQPVHDHVREFCESESIPVFDLHDSFREFDGPELWVHPTDQHPNERAHQIAGEAIADFLYESDLLTPSDLP